jgi:hypothetical protein
LYWAERLQMPQEMRIAYTLLERKASQSNQQAYPFYSHPEPKAKGLVPRRAQLSFAKNRILSFGFAQDRLCFAPQNDIPTRE